ncbi:MAG: hypothetical protein PWP10_3088 [Clostridiales bacterium]|nr:hypothetical protein [Clostridiales bacterium]
MHASGGKRGQAEGKWRQVRRTTVVEMRYRHPSGGKCVTLRCFAPVETRYRYPSGVKLTLTGDFIHDLPIMHRFMQASEAKRSQVGTAVPVRVN